MTFILKKLLITGTFAGLSGLATFNLIEYWDYWKWNVVKAQAGPCAKSALPTREDLLKALKETEFDVIVIGGGITGAGCALEAATRGLKTGLVEAGDYSCGTSSKSTKLIHGGVRYLQKAIMKLDREQYRLVRESLSERKTVLMMAPHLTSPMPILLPAYQLWQVPFFWSGMKLYDLLAMTKNVKGCYYLNKDHTLEVFPLLKKENLCGSIVYYDGQMDDSRLNLAVIISAIRHGCKACNYVSANKLIKSKDRICAVEVKDEVTGKKFKIKTKCVINATGPFTDSIRKMDNPKVENICIPSCGTHIMLPGYFTGGMGLIDPDTSDGRIVFFLPFQNYTLAGTTDSKCSISPHPAPTEEDICFIMTEVKKYIDLNVDVRRGDVSAAWSGIRPLIIDPSKTDTQSLARTHIIEVSASGLVTIAGGKWTTFRAMAEKTINTVVCKFSFTDAGKSKTKSMLLEGAEGWSPVLFVRLVQDYGFDLEVAKHLSNAYGDMAYEVAKLSDCTGRRYPVLGKRLHPDFPYIEAEVRYCCREYVVNATDLIARRLRIAFLNSEATLEILPRVIQIMAEELHWNEKEKKKQEKEAREFLLKDMGHGLALKGGAIPPKNLNKDEEDNCVANFRALDQDNRGYISVNDLQMGLNSIGYQMDEANMNSLLKTVDLPENGRVSLLDFLEISTAIKRGYFGNIDKMDLSKIDKTKFSEIKSVSVNRSCGDL